MKKKAPMVHCNQLGILFVSCCPSLSAQDVKCPLDSLGLICPLSVTVETLTLNYGRSNWTWRWSYSHETCVNPKTFDFLVLNRLWHRLWHKVPAEQLQKCSQFDVRNDLTYYPEGYKYIFFLVYYLLLEIIEVNIDTCPCFSMFLWGFV